MNIPSQNPQQNDTEGKRTAPDRREYRSPVLTRYGDIRDITLGLPGTKADGSNFGEPQP